MKQTKGITLIALVITIIVLLILAGVTIAALTGENGIITNAQKAQIETRAGAVEEKVELWKLEKETMDSGKTEEELLQGLLNEKLVDEKEINEFEKIITIGDRKISYELNDLAELEDDDINTELKTMILVYEVEANELVHLPCLYYANGNNDNYDCEVDWGDGTEIINLTESNLESAREHVYTTGGEKIIKINGRFNNFYSYSTSNLTEIKQWGDTELKKVEINYNLKSIGTPSKNSFKNLEEIIIKKQSIDISENFLLEARNLKRIEFSSNKFTQIPSRIFKNCTNLEEIFITYNDNIEEIPEQLLYNNTNLINFIFVLSPITSIPKKLFENNINLTGVQIGGCSIKEISSELFKNNINIQRIDLSNNEITQIPEGLLENNTELIEFSFAGNSLETIPTNLFEKNIKLESFDLSYNNFTEIPENLLSNCTNLVSVEQSFCMCSNLKSIPENLFENCENIQSFVRTFYECTSLEGSSTQLWTRGDNSVENEYKGNPDGGGCYYGCESLNDYDEIPEYWKEDNMLRPN